ncbi:MAG: hypothetical protein NTV22_12240, partial [bacterium]|nr:hypothetical protein [bacterium]
MKMRNLLVLATGFILACSKAHQPESVLRTNTVTSNGQTVVEQKALVKELSPQNTATSAVRATVVVDVARVALLVRQFEDQYTNGTGLLPSTLETIAIARALRTNTTLSASEKLKLLGVRHSSMASLGAELLLFQHEYARSDLTAQEKVQVLERMAAIYDLCFHAEECMAALEAAQLLLAEAGISKELANEYWQLAMRSERLLNDPQKALEYYKKALDITARVVNYPSADKEWMQEICQSSIIEIYLFLGQQEQAKKLFDEYGCAGKDSFRHLETCFRYPGQDMERRSPPHTIGKDSEIAGLEDMMKNMKKD